MNLKDLGKPLDISQIDFRVQSINNGGYATILAYKDARVDMDRLDEVVGPGNWQRDHVLIDGQLFCRVGIYDPDKGAWVWKQDVGIESSAAKEKGRASDSFKRACFNWGIGRELYEFPDIKIKLKDDEYKTENGTNRATWKLQLNLWRWYVERDERGVSFLAAMDDSNNVRFQWGERKAKKAS